MNAKLCRNRGTYARSKRHTANYGLGSLDPNRELGNMFAKWTKLF